MAAFNQYVSSKTIDKMKRELAPLVESGQFYTTIEEEKENMDKRWEKREEESQRRRDESTRPLN
jgi:hypothetical protein